MTWFGWNANALPSSAGASAATAAAGSPSARWSWAARLHHWAPSASPLSASRAGSSSPRRELGAQLPLAQDAGEEVLRAQALGEPLAVAVGGERLGVVSRARREHPPDVVQRDVRRQLGGTGQDRLGAVEGLLALLEPPALDQQRREVELGHADDRERRPAEALGDRDRLAHVALGESDAAGQVRHGAERREAADLEVRARQPAPERERRLEMRLRVREPQRPALGDPEVQQRERLELLAHRRALSPQQRGRLVDDGRELAEAPGAQQHDRRQRRPRAMAALRGQRGQRLLRGRDQRFRLTPARLLEQVRGRDRRQLRVRPDARVRQAGEQRAERLLLAIEQQVHPVAAEQLAGQVPVAGELRVPDRLDRVAVLGVPLGREPVQPGDRVGGAALELEPQQVGEQVVAAEPRAGDIDGDDERVRRPRGPAGSGCRRAARSGGRRARR